MASVSNSQRIILVAVSTCIPAGASVLKVKYFSGETASEEVASMPSLVVVVCYLFPLPNPRNLST